MSINSLNFWLNYSNKNSILSEETIRKLIALGIDPSTVCSEQQAKTIIENTLNIASVQKIPQPSSQNSCTSELEIRTKAINLAQKINIKIDSKHNIDEILQKINAKINLLLQKDNSVKSEQYISYQNELLEIQTQYTQIKQNEQAIYNSMDFSANINRLLLGI